MYKRITGVFRTFLWYFAIGAGYSYCFLLIGYTFLFYLLNFSLAQAGVFGCFAGILGVVLNLFLRRVFTHIIVSVGILLHFSTWIIFFHSSAILSSYKFIVTTLGLLLFLAITGFFKIPSFQVPIRYSSMIALFCLVAVILGGKILLTRCLSQSYIRNGVSSKVSEGSSFLGEFFYPFSLSLGKGLNRFSLLQSQYNPKKGIVLILFDALRKDYVGAKYNGLEITPTIDDLSDKGIKFSRYYVQGVWTPPSTASLFTGKYLSEHGVCLGSEGGKGQILESRHNTLAERLREKNYFNVGSVFNGHLAKRTGYNQGFDYWTDPFNGWVDDYFSSQELIFKILRRKPDKYFIYWHLEGSHYPYRRSFKNSEYWKHTDYYENGRVKFHGWDLGDPAEFDRTYFKKLRQNEATEKINKQEIRILRHLYLSKLNFYDKGYLSEFLESLKSGGLFTDSFTIVTGDHGEEIFDHSKNGSFGHNQYMFQTVLNPPLILKPPNNYELPDNLENREPTLESIDLTATLLDFAGADRGNISGQSFLPLLTTDSTSKNIHNYAISERCEIVSFDKAEKMAPETFRKKFGVTEAAYVEYPWKLNWYYPKEKDGLQQTRLYRIQNQVIQESQVENRHDKIRSLKKKLDRAVGSDTHFQVNPGPVKNFSNERTEHFKGLGYVN